MSQQPDDSIEAVAEEETAQQRFDRLYITAHEIYKTHRVSRPALLSARRRGLMPMGINMGGGGMIIWERTDELRTALDAWKHILDVRRAGSNKG